MYLTPATAFQGTPSNTQVNFGQRFPYQYQAHRTRIINDLYKKGKLLGLEISYKDLGNEIITGRDLSKYIKEAIADQKLRKEQAKMCMENDALKASIIKKHRNPRHIFWSKEENRPVLEAIV